MATDAGGVIRRHITYHGHVQGVCFRAIARELAGGRRVVGFVRNLPDGSVELEAEGSHAEVDALLQAIERHFAGYIQRTQRVSLPPRGDETRFEIRY